ncbi:MAG: hypothetical protein M3Y62_08615 [Candidatus Dormibacteraeota bacterium]|nr:hypothetical protein [Candidatus Dormibacteraeota bacterium]
MLNVRRLAAIDMQLHGTRVILWEFGLGAGLCVAFGVLSVALGVRLLKYGLNWQLFLGLGLLSVGVNYLPLVIHGLDLARRGTVREEAGLDTSPDAARRYTVLQLWLLVPFALVALALAQRSQR